MRRTVITLSALAAWICASANAAQITWTGAANNGQWDTYTNWYPPQVPAGGDTVTINSGGVTMTSPVDIQSLTLGGSAALTIDNSLSLNSLSASAGTTLVLPSGASAVTVANQAAVGGSLNFASGSISGAWTVAAGGAVNFQGAGQKSLKGATVTVGCAVQLNGVVSLSGASSVSFDGAVIAADKAAFLAGDKSGNGIAFTTAGSFQLQGAAQVYVPSVFTNVVFPGSGVSTLALYAPATFKTTVSVPTAAAIATFGAGSASGAFNGTGTISNAGAGVSLFGPMAFSGDVMCSSGPCTFAGAGAVTLNGLALKGGSLVVNVPTTAMTLNVTGGSFAGGATLTVSTLNAISTAGVELGASVTVAAALKMSASQWTVAQGGSLHILKGASGTMGAVEFAGQGAVTSTPSIVNNAALRIIDALTLNSVAWGGAGTATIRDAITLSVTDAGFTSASVVLGSGAILNGLNSCVSVNAINSATSAVTAKIGSYSMVCPNGCVNLVAPCVPTPTGGFEFTA